MKRKLILGIMLGVVVLGALAWLKFSRTENVQEIHAELPKATVIRRSNSLPRVHRVQRIYRSPVVTSPVVRAPVAPVKQVVDPRIVKVRHQINEIIEMNKTLKVQHQSQVAEIQRITEQAQIHKKILEKIGEPTDSLEKEKVELIEKQTMEHRELLQKLEDQSQ